MSIDIKLHKTDLPDDLNLGNIVAVDGEFTSLDVKKRSNLCLLQISSGNQDAHIVQLDRDNYNAPNLVNLFSNKKYRKTRMVTDSLRNRTIPLGIRFQAFWRGLG